MQRGPATPLLYSLLLAADGAAGPAVTSPPLPHSFWIPPPRQVDARGSADARSSADACLSCNRRCHRLTEPTTKALCQPPCGDTWVCQVVIALWEITQATACTAKKRSRLITNRNVRS